VYWLTDPGALGCQPADLVLTRAVGRPEGSYFVFRFRAGGGNATQPQVFFAGISGPWRNGHLSGTANTFSEFKPAAAAAPEEHLKRILAIVKASG
jgi:hypothetical protein